MTERDELKEFYTSFTSSVIDRMNEFENAEHSGTSLVEIITSDLEAEDFVNSSPNSSFCKTSKGEIHGFSIDYQHNRLDIFFGLFFNDKNDLQNGPSTLRKSKSDVAFSRMLNFIDDVENGNHPEYDPSSESSEIVSEIKNFLDSDENLQIRLFVFTNLKTRVEALTQNELFKNTGTSFELWDIARIFKFHSSGLETEPINLIPEQYNNELNYIPVQTKQELFKAFLTAMPGEMLATLYKEYGQRLLESNVRSFLQNRTKVNRGIRDTIVNEPERFTAYNNGITIIAESITLSENRIEEIKDFQIVNGGQTTASLYEAYLNKNDLSDIFVPVKLIQLFGDYETKHKNIQTITRFANANNTVKLSDFSANDKFFIEIEKFSRTLYVNPRLGRQQPTKWFFERARGQYNELRARAKPGAERKKFDAEYPKSGAGENISQLLKKEDLAKFYMAWQQQPHYVSQGATKVFNQYIKYIDTKSVPEETEYKNLIAKAVLYRVTEKIIAKRHTTKDRSPRVAYTISYLSKITNKNLDLMKIYDTQDIDTELWNYISEISDMIVNHLNTTNGDRTSAEWAKRIDCWNLLLKNDNNFNFEIGDEWISDNNDNDDSLDQDSIRICSELDSKLWWEIASWGKDTGQLEPKERSQAANMGKTLGRKKTPSIFLAKACVPILIKAHDNGGFDLSEDLYSDIMQIIADTEID